MQEHYGIDLERAAMGEHSASHIAVLAVHLPQKARVRVAEDPDNSWGLAETVGAAIFNQLRAMAYGMSDKKKAKEPEPIGPSHMRGKGTKKLPAMAMTKEELMRQLSKPRIGTIRR